MLLTKWKKRRRLTFSYKFFIFFCFFQNNAVLLLRLMSSTLILLRSNINLQLYRFLFNQIRIHAICIYTFSIFLRFSFIVTYKVGFLFVFFSINDILSYILIRLQRLQSNFPNQRWQKCSKFSLYELCIINWFFAFFSCCLSISIFIFLEFF